MIVQVTIQTWEWWSIPLLSAEQQYVWLRAAVRVPSAPSTNNFTLSQDNLFPRASFAKGKFCGSRLWKYPEKKIRMGIFPSSTSSQNSFQVCCSHAWALVTPFLTRSETAISMFLFFTTEVSCMRSRTLSSAVSFSTPFGLPWSLCPGGYRSNVPPGGSSESLVIPVRWNGKTFAKVS